MTRQLISVINEASGEVSQVALSAVKDEGGGSGIPTSYLDTDITLAANSDSKIATQKAVKAYVAANAGGGGLGAPPTIHVEGVAGDYPLAKATVYVRDANEVEMIRVVATGGDPAVDYNARNLFIGYQTGPAALDDAGGGWRNVGIGIQALHSITAGWDNYGVGYQALYSLTTGTDNTAFGYYALKGVVSGESNTAVGNSALYQATGNNNVALGAGAGQNVGTGNLNTFVGDHALGAASLSNSTAIGANAVVSADNRAVIGDGNVTDVYLGSETPSATLHPKVLELYEISDPAAAPANHARLYARDNGGGKTQIVAIFPSGAVQVIATEP